MQLESSRLNELVLRAGLELEEQNVEVNLESGTCESHTADNSHMASQKSVVVCPQLAEVWRRWPSLSLHVKDAILALSSLSG